MSVRLYDLAEFVKRGNRTGTTRASRYRVSKYFSQYGTISFILFSNLFYLIFKLVETINKPTVTRVLKIGRTSKVPKKFP